MARTIPAAHVVVDAVRYQPGQAIYTTPLGQTALNANFLLAEWSPNYSIQCLDGTSNTYCTEAGAGAYTEHVVLRFPVQGARGNIRVRVRMRSVNAPTGAAAACQIRTTSGTALINLPSGATAQTFAWYLSTAQAYDTTGTHDYVSVALQANLQASGDVHLAAVEVYYSPATSLGAGVLAGTFRATDSTAWQADEALSPRRARDVDAAFEHLHKNMLWPIAWFADDLQNSKGVWNSTTSTAWQRVLGPVRIPTMGGKVVDEIGFSALAIGPAAADRVRIYTTDRQNDDLGDPMMIDSHTWTPALTAFAATEWRTAGNWEDHVLTVNATRPTYLFLDVKGNGASSTYLYSLSLWATAR